MKHASIVPQCHVLFIDEEPRAVQAAAQLLKERSWRVSQEDFNAVNRRSATGSADVDYVVLDIWDQTRSGPDARFWGIEVAHSIRRGEISSIAADVGLTFFTQLLQLPRSLDDVARRIADLNSEAFPKLRPSDLALAVDTQLSALYDARVAAKHERAEVRTNLLVVDSYDKEECYGYIPTRPQLGRFAVPMAGLPLQIAQMIAKSAREVIVALDHVESDTPEELWVANVQFPPRSRSVLDAVGRVRVGDTRIEKPTTRRSVDVVDGQTINRAIALSRSSEVLGELVVALLSHGWSSAQISSYLLARRARFGGECALVVAERDPNSTVLAEFVSDLVLRYSPLT